MRPSKKSAAKKDANKPGAPSPAPVPTAVPDVAGPKTERMSFTLDASGKPDVERMHPKTRERVAAMFRDPDVARSFGLTGDEAAAGGGAVSVPRDLVMWMTATLSQLQMLLILRTTKAPAPIVQQFGGWSKEEQEAIADPLGQVLDKYAAGPMSKYGPEINLAGILLAVTMKKIQIVNDMTERHRATGPRPEPARFPQRPEVMPGLPADAPLSDLPAAEQS